MIDSLYQDLPAKCSQLSLSQKDIRRQVRSEKRILMQDDG